MSENAEADITSNAVYRVVIRDDPLKTRWGANLMPNDTALRFESRNDGKMSILLHPEGHSPLAEGSRTMREVLAEIQNDPKLSLLSMPVVRDLQDTEIMWSAWKVAMLDTIGGIFDQKLLMTLQLFCRDDDTAPRWTLKETQHQMQTTIGTWREHLKFIAERRDMIANSIAQQEVSLRHARDDLERVVSSLGPDSRSAATARVLINASAALEATRNERRELHVRKLRHDRESHLNALRACVGALAHYLNALEQDLASINAEAIKAHQAIGEGVLKKRAAWAGVCRALQERYMRDLHVPLQHMLHEFRTTRGMEQLPTTLEAASAALDDTNDPHCVQRCGLALAELDAVCDYLRRLSVPTVMEREDTLWDDMDLASAKEKNRSERAEAELEHTQRLEKLESEHVLRARELARAKTHLKQLHQQAEELNRQVGAHWINTSTTTADVEANKRVAALTRVANQRRAVLREEMQRTGETIQQLSKELASSRANVTVEDRHVQAMRLRSHAVSIHDLCKRMRSQFEAVVASEELIRHTVQDQLLQSARAAHSLTSSVAHRVMDTTRSEFNRIRVALRRIDAEIEEATRRMTTLNEARLQEECRLLGPEIPVLTSLEEMVAVSNQMHDLRDISVRVDAMCLTCEAALALLQDMSSAIGSSV